MKLSAEDAFRLYGDRVFSAAFSVTGNQADADDAVQDTYLRYCSYDKEFADEDHLRAWLLRVAINRARDQKRSFWEKHRVSWEDYMETIFVTESREMLFTGTEDIDVRPLHSSELHYEGDSREEALRAAHKVSAASRVGVCQRGFARFVATVSEITHDGEGFTEHMDTVHTVDPLDRMPELRTLAREAAANRADGKIIRHIAGHTEAIDAAKRAGNYYSLYRVEGSAFGDFSCYRVGPAPYNGTLYLPAGFHDYGIATVDELFVALVVGRCEFLCEYQDEIDEVYHGLFEKRI